MGKIKGLARRCLGYVQKALQFGKATVLSYVFFFAPVQKQKVLFINFNGKGFGCNPKYIALELRNQSPELDLVWLVKNMDEPMPEWVRKAGFGTARGLYELATAKVIVTNVKNEMHLVKKKDQYLIQTWHGSYSSKLLEQDAAATLPKRYLRASKKNSAMTDLFLSNSRVLSDCYRNAFWCKCEIMECGFPRNDVLFGQTPEQVAAIRQRLGVPEDAKLALYAPTFRDDGSTDCYSLDCQAVLDTLASTGNWYLLVRLHPNVGSAADLFPFGERILDATPYPDMQELLVAGDILITDYSSTVFEFAALGKPSFIYACDVEAYQRMRGLKEDFFRMPYPVCRTNEELLAQLAGLTEASGREKAAKFMAFFGGMDKGDASQQVAKRIMQVVG